MELAYETAALWGQALPEGRFRSGANKQQGRCEVNKLRSPFTHGFLWS